MTPPSLLRERLSQERALAQFAPESWPDVTFAFHPSVQALEFLSGIAAAYAHVREQRTEEKASRQIETERETIISWRNDNSVFYRVMGAEEKFAQAAAARGQSFGEICGLLSQRDGDASADEAAGLLARWFNDGLVAKVTA